MCSGAFKAALATASRTAYIPAMAAPPLLTLQNIRLTLGGGGAPLLAGADLSVAAGARRCRVGGHGAVRRA